MKQETEKLLASIALINAAGFRAILDATGGPHVHDAQRRFEENIEAALAKIEGL